MKKNLKNNSTVAITADTTTENNYDVISLKKIKPKAISWMVKDFLAYGKLSMLQSDPGAGKTTMALKICSDLSNGITPFGEKLAKPINTLLLLSEDDCEDTIIPKLLKMGAKLEHIFILITKKDTDFPTLTDERIEETVKKYKIALIVIDPLQSFLPDNVDMNKMSDVRPVMKQLINMAKRNYCSVFILQHLNKNTHAKNVYRGSGSLDFNASARVVITIMKPIREESKGNSRNLRYAQITKSNIGQDNQCLFFRLNDTNVVEWVMKEELTENELMLFKPANAITKKEEVTNYIKQKLKGGEQPVTELINKITHDLGVSRDTVNIAKRDSGVKSVKRGANWYWYL